MILPLHLPTMLITEAMIMSGVDFAFFISFLPVKQYLRWLPDVDVISLTEPPLKCTTHDVIASDAFSFCLM